jgi:hypothetical protein
MEDERIDRLKISPTVKRGRSAATNENDSVQPAFIRRRQGEVTFGGRKDERDAQNLNCVRTPHDPADGEQFVLKPAKTCQGARKNETMISESVS